MFPATGFLCKQELTVTPDQCSRFCFSGKNKTIKELFQISRGTPVFNRREKGHTIFFLSLDKSHCVPLSYIQNISVMNIQFSNLSTSSAWPLAPLFVRTNISYLFSFSWLLLTLLSCNSLLGCWFHGPIMPVGIADTPSKAPVCSSHLIPCLCSPSLLPSKPGLGFAITLVVLHVN